ncbi:MAG: hypothetical protein IPL73_14855 [Candidatus Obscuribacter sp.]|nr:hypothetical protein [Candidatus Obscuribacter sp.]
MPNFLYRSALLVSLVVLAMAFCAAPSEAQASRGYGQARQIQTGSGHFEEYTSPQYNAYETQQRLGSGSASAYDIAQYTGFP